MERDNNRRSYGGGMHRKKVRQFCAEQVERMDNTDAETLKKLITERGKILPRRITGTCTMHQREVSKAIKMARTVAILPFDAD